MEKKQFMDNLLNATCRVALAGMIHDLGKFAQRAGIEPSRERIDIHSQLFCPRGASGAWTHQHAAYTAMGFPVIERAAPELLRADAWPFASRVSENPKDLTESLVGVASRHHAPETFLDWILATADHVASGFERECFDKGDDDAAAAGFIETRMRSLLEEVSLHDSRRIARSDLRTALPLTPLTPKALFPVPLAQVESKDRKRAVEEYARLWKAFSDALDPAGATAIPGAFRRNWPLWLDVFDTAWLTFTQAIPSATWSRDGRIKPDVSLYDHSKAVAAIAAALWRWHEEKGATGAEAISAMKRRADWSERKLLLIQADFFGIQGFIFSEGSETNRHSAKVLRGRSFYVSLLCELAALRVLEALELPSTSQIINAAGKFLIVAPNTGRVRARLEAVRAELDAWFVKNTFAVSGIGIASTEAACEDFCASRYGALTERLYEALEKAKHQRFGLTRFSDPVLSADYSEGVCRWQSRLPADGLAGGGSCALSRDQILIGKSLANFSRLLVLDEDADIRSSNTVAVCELPVFGYRIAFAQDRETSGSFSALAASGRLHRCWDFSLPESEDEVLWRGFARRNINGYVPRFTESDFLAGAASDDDDLRPGRIKTFEAIAASGSDGDKGAKALMTLKGDVDNLGLIFQKGLTDDTAGHERVMTFAKTATLSRQMNAFFAVWLPLLCRREHPNMYTVFAGGDDFFLIGPWRESQRLARSLAESFRRFAAENADVHFSAGLVMTKPAVPPRTVARIAEEALSQAKGFDTEKNAVTLHGETVRWTDMPLLEETEAFLAGAGERFGISKGYLYGLFRILEMAGDADNPAAAMWRSKLYYSTTRLFERQHVSRSTDMRQAREEFLATIMGALEREKSAFRIPLSNVFYSNRIRRGH